MWANFCIARLVPILWIYIFGGLPLWLQVAVKVRIWLIINFVSKSSSFQSFIRYRNCTFSHNLMHYQKSRAMQLHSRFYFSVWHLLKFHTFLQVNFNMWKLSKTHRGEHKNFFRKLIFSLEIWLENGLKSAWKLRWKIGIIAYKRTKVSLKLLGVNGLVQNRTVTDTKWANNVLKWLWKHPKFQLI